MEGPNAVLNVITIPPGATKLQQRIVIDGTRGALLLYQNGGQLVGSIAMASGTDPYGHFYPKGFATNDAGNDISNWTGAQLIFQFLLNTPLILNSQGLFLYSPTIALGNLIVSLASNAGVDSVGNSYPEGLNVSTGSVSGTDLILYSTGTPSANNLVASLAGAAFTDSVGNDILQGLTLYFNGGPSTYFAQNFINNLIRFYQGTSEAAWTLNGQVVFTYTAISLQHPSGNGFAQLGLAPAGGELILQDSSGNIGTILTGTGGDLLINNNAGYQATIDTALTDINDFTLGNSTSASPLSATYNIPANDAQVGTEYIIEAPFTGVHEGQVLNMGFILDGTFHNLSPIGGAFTATGDNTVGTIRLHMRCTATGAGGTAHIWNEGTIDDSSVNRLGSNTVPFSGYLASQALPTAVSHTLAIGASYGGAAAGQTTTGHGSTFNRKGP